MTKNYDFTVKGGNEILDCKYNKKATIVLDFDGTIFSTARRIFDIVQEEYPEKYIGGRWQDIRKLGLKPVIDIDQPTIHKIFQKKDFYIEEYLMDGVIDFIKGMQNAGHTVEILTVGNTFNNFNKALLLEKMGLNIKINFINSVGDGTVSFDKSTYRCNRETDELGIYVDDRLECLESVNNFTNKLQMSEDGMILENDENLDFENFNSWVTLSRYIIGLINFYK